MLYSAKGLGGMWMVILCVDVDGLVDASIVMYTVSSLLDTEWTHCNAPGAKNSGNANIDYREHTRTDFPRTR